MNAIHRFLGKNSFAGKQGSDFVRDMEAGRLVMHITIRGFERFVTFVFRGAVLFECPALEFYQNKNVQPVIDQMKEAGWELDRYPCEIPLRSNGSTSEVCDWIFKKPIDR